MGTPAGFIPDEAPDGFIPDEPEPITHPDAEQAGPAQGRAHGRGINGGRLDPLRERIKANPEQAGDLRNTMEIGPGEAAGRGALKGGSYGFSNRMAGVGSALAGGSYEQGKDQYTQADDAAADQNPLLFHTSELAANAAVSPPVAPEASLLKREAVAIGEGMFTGAGYSRADNPSELALDTATGGVVNGVVSTGMHGAQKALAGTEPRLARFAQNRRMAQLGITNKTAEEFPSGGAQGLLRRLQGQGVATGMEGRGRALEQVEQANVEAEARRAAAIPDQNAPVSGKDIAARLRARSRKFGGEDVRDVRRQAIRQQAQGFEQQAGQAEQEASQLEQQGQALGLDKKFARSDPNEPMRAPPARAELADTAEAPTGTAAALPSAKRAGPRQQVPLVDERQAQRERTPASVMGGPKNARKQARAIDAARQRAAGLRQQGQAVLGQIAPEGRLGAGERRIMEQEAGALEPDTLSMGELNKRRAEYGQAWQRPNSTADEAQAYQAAHGETNDILQGEIDKANPGQGQQWREAGRDQAALIDARQGLTTAMAQQDRAPMAGGVNLGLAVFSPKALIAKHVIQGREHAIAAYGAEQLLKVPKSPFGRALRSRNLVGNLASRVGVEAAAREHFLRSADDPAYHEQAYAE